MANEATTLENFGKNEEKMRENYIYKDGCYYQPIENTSFEHMDPIIIDYSLLISSASSKSREELEKFKSALSSWGCLQLINHGMPTTFLNEIKELSKPFFGLPLEEKLKYSMLPEEGKNGYGTGVNTPTTIPTNKILDWNEGLTLTLFPEDRRLLEFWPEKPLHFKEVLDEFTTRLTTIFDTLFKLVLRSLNVDEERVAKHYGKNKEINLRFNFYPKCPGFKQVLGLKPHADFSAFTLLLQDEEGLQVFKDDQWFVVSIRPDAIFLNIGDALEIMSNGILKSAVHRAVINTEKERVSVAIFWDSDRDAEIGPLDELVTTDRPQLYQKSLLKDYVNNFFQYYELGKRPINDLKI